MSNISCIMILYYDSYLHISIQVSFWIPDVTVTPSISVEFKSFQELHSPTVVRGMEGEVGINW